MKLETLQDEIRKYKEAKNSLEDLALAKLKHIEEICITTRTAKQKVNKDNGTDVTHKFVVPVANTGTFFVVNEKIEMVLEVLKIEYETRLSNAERVLREARITLDD